MGFETIKITFIFAFRHLFDLVWIERNVFLPLILMTDNNLINCFQIKKTIYIFTFLYFK